MWATKENTQNIKQYLEGGFINKYVQNVVLYVYLFCGKTEINNDFKNNTFILYSVYVIKNILYAVH